MANRVLVEQEARSTRKPKLGGSNPTFRTGRDGEFDDAGPLLDVENAAVAVAAGGETSGADSSLADLETALASAAEREEETQRETEQGVVDALAQELDGQKAPLAKLEASTASLADLETKMEEVKREEKETEQGVVNALAKELDGQKEPLAKLEASTASLADLETKMAEVKREEKETETKMEAEERL